MKGAESGSFDRFANLRPQFSAVSILAADQAGGFLFSGFAGG